MKPIKIKDGNIFLKIVLMASLFLSACGNNGKKSSTETIFRTETILHHSPPSPPLPPPHQIYCRESGSLM